jgi:hypothetical protein
MIVRSPPVESICVTNPGLDDLDPSQHNGYYNTVDRYLLRPDQFAAMDIATYYGQTNRQRDTATKALPQIAQEHGVRDKCAGAPATVWLMNPKHFRLVRLVRVPKKNTEDFWLRELLRIPGFTPTSRRAIRTFEGVEYDGYSDTADAVLAPPCGGVGPPPTD